MAAGLAVVAVAASTALAAAYAVPGRQPFATRLTSGSTQPDAPSPLHGTWLLTGLSSSQATVSAALANVPAVRGLSIWAGWNQLAGGSAQIAKMLGPWKSFADARGLALAVRFVAGAQTPSAVFAAGAPSVLDAHGHRIPLPWDPSTGGPNLVFERQYQAFVDQLAAWCTANGVAELHLSWYGDQYAELYNGPQITSAPGYSYIRLVTGYERLFDIGAAVRSSSLAVEYPLTGDGNVGQLAKSLAGYIDARVPPGDPTLYVQLNGWGVNGSNGVSQPFLLDEHHTRRGLQDDAAGGTAGYSWSTMYASLEAAHADYAEIWLGAFTAANAPQLQAAAAAFAASSNVLPSTSAVTVTAPTAPVVTNTAVPVTVSVSTPQGDPTGTITLEIDGTAVKTVPLPFDTTILPTAGRTETVSTSYWPKQTGTFTMTASYSGDPSTAAGSASTTLQVISQTG